jgi:hypothetical protein
MAAAAAAAAIPVITSGRVTATACYYTDYFHNISIVNTTESVEPGNNTKESNTTSNFSKK